MKTYRIICHHADSEKVEEFKVDNIRGIKQGGATVLIFSDNPDIPNLSLNFNFFSSVFIEDISDGVEQSTKKGPTKEATLKISRN